MNRARFFDAVRKNPFGGSLSADQVSGTEAILNEWEARRLTDLRWLAYMLATAFHETAHTMQPIKEYGSRAYFMRMYDMTGERPKVAKQLGNTVAGDGAEFCGRGYVQLTGRTNYLKASEKIGVDFIRRPSDVMIPANAAQIMFAGMIDGWFTTKKLSDYFTATKADWKNARRIINGTDRADTIADYAKAFHAALVAAQDASPEPVQPPSEPAAIPQPPDVEVAPAATPARQIDDPGPVIAPEPERPRLSGRANAFFLAIIFIVITAGAIVAWLRS